MTRSLTILSLLFVMALPAAAERPRPLGWAMDAVRAGNWDNAARLAARDGDVARDVIEWHRLREGRGSFVEVAEFLIRRPNWPGEDYLRRQSEAVVALEDDRAVLSFFARLAPQTPAGVLAQVAALNRSDRKERATELLTSAWSEMAMDDATQARFLADYAPILKPLHAVRLDAMLWAGALDNAQRMLPLVGAADAAVAKARIALHKKADGVDALIAAVPASHADTPGLHYDRFVWRSGKGRTEDAKDLMLERSVSAASLGRPEEWANRRRSLARDEMRDGDAKRAYRLASQHFLTQGADYADLEWLSGYIALRKLNDPSTALRHFDNHDAAVVSPISKGRAGYWRGRAYEAMGNVTAADQAYARGAQHQTSFYGLLAAERADLPFDVNLSGSGRAVDWREAAFVQDPVFQAGILMQASGETSLAERFWTHLAEQLNAQEAEMLGQAALDVGQPHLAVMIGKRVAERGIVLPEAYYPLHPMARLSVPMAAEMTLSIARRESEFDPFVRSGAGALGLMQIMPATGREVASRLGRTEDHSDARMLSDPDYAVLLGATYLAGLSRQFDGNVVMMAAGYNAGPSRPERWMQLYGDPRTSGVDIVDWIEHIPFRETQNYVMRVTESLPIYRARLGGEPLPLPFSAELTGSTLLSFAPKGE